MASVDAPRTRRTFARLDKSIEGSNPSLSAGKANSALEQPPAAPGRFELGEVASSIFKCS